MAMALLDKEEIERRKEECRKSKEFDNGLGNLNKGVDKKKTRVYIATKDENAWIFQTGRVAGEQKRVAPSYYIIKSLEDKTAKEFTSKAEAEKFLLKKGYKKVGKTKTYRKSGEGEKKRPKK